MLWDLKGERYVGSSDEDYNCCCEQRRRRLHVAGSKAKVDYCYTVGPYRTKEL
jgi:hypothetical protein